MQRFVRSYRSRSLLRTTLVPLVLALVFAAVVFINGRFKNAFEWTGWVEAIGSVGAIFFSIRVGKAWMGRATGTREQSEQERLFDEKKQAVQNACVLESLAWDAYRAVAGIRMELVTAHLARDDRTRIDRLADIARSIEDGSPDSSRPGRTSRIIDIRRYLFEAISVLSDTEKSDPAKREAFSEIAHHLYQIKRELTDVVEEAYWRAHEVATGLSTQESAQKWAETRSAPTDTH